MAETIVSFRVDKSIHNQMKMHDEINWSAIFRKSVSQTLQATHSLDREKAMKALQAAGKIREQSTWNAGKSSNEIIREWRNKRK